MRKHPVLGQEVLVAGLVIEVDRANKHGETVIDKPVGRCIQLAIGIREHRVALGV